MSQELPQRLLRLQLIVVALGETVVPPWWPTRYLSPPGISFLKRIYPRSAILAALKSSSEGARAAHDAAIGKAGPVHLFRLPFAVESRLAEYESGPSGLVALAQIEPILGKSNELLIALAHLGSSPGNGGVGAVRIGRASEVVSAEGVSHLASIYASGFEANRRVFPFFEG